MSLFLIEHCFTEYYVTQHVILINLQNDTNFCMI